MVGFFLISCFDLRSGSDVGFQFDLHWALKKARVAPDTATIVKIAVELFKRIREQEEQGQGQQEQEQDGQPSDGEGQPSDGQPSDGEGQPSDKPSEGGNPSDKPSEGDGEKGEGEGQPSDGQPSDGQPSDEQGEGDKPNGGNGYSNEEYDGGREVEPSNFIEDELVKISKSSDAVSNRPAVGKPRIETFNWR